MRRRSTGNCAAGFRSARSASIRPGIITARTRRCLPNPVGLDGYTRTKAEAEFLLNHHIQEHGFPAVIVRPGLIYGPGDRHALPRFVEKIESGKMKFLGRGDRVLNNTYVENLVDAMLLAIESPGCHSARRSTFATSG